MQKQFSNISQRQSALIAGVGLLIMTLFAIYAYNFIFPKLIVFDDAYATVHNIKANEFHFRIGVCSYLVVIICDIVVAWSLYIFLKPVDQGISLLTAWLRLVYATIYAMALVSYFNVLQLLNGHDYQKGDNVDWIHTEIMMAIDTFNITWSIGFIFFGLHLAVLGYLVFKSQYIPKTLGILLIIVGLSYLLDYFAEFLFPIADLDFSTYIGWGELLFMFWLLWKGCKKSSEYIQ